MDDRGFPRARRLPGRCLLGMDRRRGQLCVGHRTSRERGSNTGEWRAFGIYYDDWRTVTKVDNRSTAAKAADQRQHSHLHLYGGHYVNVTKTAAGSIDISWARARCKQATGEYRRSACGHVRRGRRLSAEDSASPEALVAGRLLLRVGRQEPERQQTRHVLRDSADTKALCADAVLQSGEHRRSLCDADSAAVSPLLRFTTRCTAFGSLVELTFGTQAVARFNRGPSATRGDPLCGPVSLANLYDVNVDVTLNSHIVITPYLGHAAGKIGD